MPDQGIILLGCPRSGTPLLRRILGAHPEIHCPGETGLFRGCSRLLDSEQTGVGVEMGVLGGLAHAGFDAKQVLERTRRFAFSFLDEVTVTAGKRRWLEKDAFNSFHAEKIAQLCGQEVQYICLVRHGMDVASSLRDLCDKSESYVLNLHRYVAEDKRPLEAFSKAWVAANEGVLKVVEARPDQVILIRYEDLVGNPRSQLQRIAEFLGVNLPHDLVETALSSPGDVGLSDWKAYARNEVDTTSVERWRQLHPFAISRMAAIVNPMLKRLGYDEVEATWDDDPDLARRKYELGLLLNAAKSKKA